MSATCLCRSVVVSVNIFLSVSFCLRVDFLSVVCRSVVEQRFVHKGGKIKNWGGECRDVTPTKSLSQNIRVDVNREVKFCFFLGGRGAGSGWGVGLGQGGGGGQGGCEQRIEVFVKIQKKNWGGGGGESGGEVGVGLGGQGGCDRRIEVLGKIHTKKNIFFWGGGGGGGSGWM